MTQRNIRENERSAAAQKAAARKKRRRRRRAAAALLFFLILCIMLLAVLCLTVFFKIETVSARGSTVYSEAQIVAASGIAADQNLFLLSDQRISEQIQTTLPFINSVKIKRILPSSVELTVTETVEEICFAAGESYCSADKTGKILIEYAEQPEGLTLVRLSADAAMQTGRPIVYGSALEEELVTGYFSLADAYGLRVNMIDVTDPYDSYIKIEDRFIVKFGTASNLELKAAHLNAMLKKMSADKQGIIDLGVWTESKQEAFFTERSISDYE